MQTYNYHDGSYLNIRRRLNQNPKKYRHIMMYILNVIVLLQWITSRVKLIQLNIIGWLAYLVNTTTGDFFTLSVIKFCGINMSRSTRLLQGWCKIIMRIFNNFSWRKTGTGVQNMCFISSAFVNFWVYIQNKRIIVYGKL